MEYENSTLVYVTGIGKIKEQKKKPEPKASKDGIVTISLKRLGGNKILSIVTGLALDEENLKELCSKLKRKCGTGGSIKDFNMEIQGDKRDILKKELETLGYKVKLSGS